MLAKAGEVTGHDTGVKAVMNDRVVYNGIISGEIKTRSGGFFDSDS